MLTRAMGELAANLSEEIYRVVVHSWGSHFTLQHIRVPYPFRDEAEADSGDGQFCSDHPKAARLEK